VKKNKAIYLVTASKWDWDEYDKILVVACSETSAIKEALECGDVGDDLRYPYFNDQQGPFKAERLKPSGFRIGDKPIASFNAG
jgi:hypothetical protein